MVKMKSPAATHPGRERVANGAEHKGRLDEPVYSKNGANGSDRAPAREYIAELGLRGEGGVA